MSIWRVFGLSFGVFFNFPLRHSNYSIYSFVIFLFLSHLTGCGLISSWQPEAFSSLNPLSVIRLHGCFTEGTFLSWFMISRLQSICLHWVAFFFWLFSLCSWQFPSELFAVGVCLCVCVCTLICAYIKKKEGRKKSFPVLISFVNNLLQSRTRRTILLWLCFLSLVLGFFALSRFSNIWRQVLMGSNTCC